MTLSIANAISPVAVSSGKGTPFTPIPESALVLLDFDIADSMIPIGGSAPIADGQDIDKMTDQASGIIFSRHTAGGPNWQATEIQAQGATRDNSTRVLISGQQLDFTSGEVSAAVVHNATTASRLTCELSVSTNPNRGFFISGLASSVCRVFDTAQVNFGANPTLDGSPHILAMRARSGAQECYEDTFTNSLGTNNAALTTLGTDFLYICGRANGSLNWLEGIGYIVIYNRWLDDSEMIKLFGYLVGRYASARYVLDDNGQPLLDDQGNPILAS